MFRYWERLTCAGLIAGGISLFLNGCSSESISETIPTVSAASAWKHTEAVAAIIPRHAGTPAHAQAVDYIRRHAPEAIVDSWVEDTLFGKVVFSNIVGEIPGHDPNRFVLVGSHFDTKQIPGFSGANDGASSTGALLALLERLKEVPPPITVRYVFFDGEECYAAYGEGDGLHGSQRYSRQLADSGELTKCVGMILLDMVGDKDLKLTLSRDTDPFWVERVRRAATELGHPERVGFYASVIHDDHVPFQLLGIPSVDLIDFEYGPRNLYWHSVQDSLDKLSPDSLAFSADLTLRLIWGL